VILGDFLEYLLSYFNYILNMMDNIDEQILDILKENSRATYVEIGRQVGLSEGAVRNRVQALIDSGVIKKFTIELAPTARVRGLIMISVDPGIPTSEISKMVDELEAVERIYEVTGDHDIVSVVASLNIEGVNQCIEEIRGIKGVVKTNTMIVLRTI
jgi:DNA-binding Lrp family transcriptional regulator